MEIAIRPRLSRADVEALVLDSLGAASEVVEHEEFTDGFFSAAHAVALADGRRLVLKVAPAKDHKLLRYEVDLMATEIECFERALAAGVPMPALRFADPEVGLMIMDRLAGVTLPNAKDAISEAELPALRREIGELSARFGAVTGERFGYPRKDGRTASDSWAESFTAIIDDILADALELNVTLPRPAAAIADIVGEHRSLLDEVTRPALVHFDLWDGNIFVVEGENGWRVEGFIDGERAFYGDSIAELASLTMFIPPAEAAEVVDGFLGRGPTAGEERRLVLYRLYLWLILATEGVVRGYEDDEVVRQHKWAYEGLEKELAILEA